MAHPKLATIVRRSLLSASAAALMVGPLAAAGAAQTTEGIQTLKMTCEEALKTEDAKLIEQFCTAEELEALSPLTKSVDETTSTTTKTVTKAVEDTAPKPDDGGGAPTAGGGTAVPETDSGGTTGGRTGGGTNTRVGTTGGEGARGFDDESLRGSSAGATASKARKAAKARAAEAPGFGYNADGPFRAGMRSHSSLTLQPFAAPLVSVPPIYELPQVAQQLFGSPSDATAAAPQGAAATAASPYSATGFSATSADPTGWLAATATGLIMLVGAGHALNGGRKPSRPKA